MSTSPLLNVTDACHDTGSAEGSPMITTEVRDFLMIDGSVIARESATHQIHKKFKILPRAPLVTPWAQTGGQEPPNALKITGPPSGFSAPGAQTGPKLRHAALVKRNVQIHKKFTFARPAVVMHRDFVGTSTNAGVVVDKNIDEHYLAR
jgi:hypothetical protein